jgi:ABC-type bacteriocin/lantibiotic exporter with double-glycine peptidase domain
VYFNDNFLILTHLNSVFQDKMGVSGMAGGLFGILLVIPLQLLTGKLMSKNNEKILACHDLRLSKSTEMIQGMKTVKLSCIESKILAGINTARSEELNYLKIDSYCWSGMTFLASVSTILMASIMIGIHTGLENESMFTSGDIFTTLALFNQLAVCLSIFPVTLPVLVKGLSSRRRLLEFLSRQEVTRYKSLTGKSQISAENSNGRKDEAFSVQNAAFSWPTAIGVLDDINLEIETGSLTVISGSGGSGKSALMLALIEEMKLTSGKLNWNLDPRIALVSQKPWY